MSFEQAHPPSEAQQLQDARTASAVAQVRIRELEEQVVKERARADGAERERDDARACLHLARADLCFLTANYERVTKARDAIIVQAHHWKRECKYFKAQLSKAYAAAALQAKEGVQ